MDGGGRVERGSSPLALSESVVVPLRRSESAHRADLARLIPSGRTVALCLGLLAAVLAGWLAARETGVFAVRSIDVRGASPGVTAQVLRTLQGTTGRSLLAVDVAAARRALEALPTIESVALDRAFPHTLRVLVTPERVVAVARQGSSSYLLSRRGRVVAAVARTDRPGLPRIWVTRDVAFSPGGLVAGDLLAAVGAVASAASGGFPARVASVTATSAELTLRLRSGLELRLGDGTDASLKLAIAARVLRLLTPGTAYLDVSVPERPVSGQTLNSQVQVYGSTSTHP